MTVRILQGFATPEKSRVLAWLSPETVELFADRIQMREYDQGEVMYRIGDPIPGPCFVERGLVTFYRSDDREPKERAGSLWPPQFALITFSEHTEWPVAVAALTPVIWGAATPEVHDEVARRLSHLFPRLVARLAHHQYVESVWRSRLAAVTIRPRLRLVLHRMARELGTQHDGGILLDFRVTSGMLAELVRGNRDEVGRAMRELLADGLVERQPGRRLWLPDPTALVEGILPDEGC